MIERARGNVFHGFEEGKLTFPPTYKFQAGTSVYERRPEKKLRAPAWCDRVLWKAKTPSHVQLQHYGTSLVLDLSDHKPVQASFAIKVKHEVDDKKNQVIKEIMLQLDKWENENMPRVKIDGGSVLAFDRVTYLVPQRKSLFVSNTGTVVAHFRFIPKLDESRICKPWLRVHPPFGMIPPKETLEIALTALVDDAVAHDLTSGADTLDDTMILRIENGRDYFLIVSGHYQP